MKNRVYGIAAFVLGIVCTAASSCAADIETTYGEDPVPPRHFMWRPFKAYGMDPVPQQSLRERWMLYRARGPVAQRSPSRPEQRSIEIIPTPPPEQAEQRRSSRRAW